MYNNLSGIKLINGLPADLTTLSKMIENDSYFKSEVDADEDLSAIDRNLIPLTTNTYDIGSASAYFKALFSKSIKTDSVNIETPSPSTPSLNFGAEVNGFLRPGSGRLAYKTGTFTPFELSSSEAKIRTSNNTQLHIESTQAGKEAVWYVGGNKDGFDFTLSADVVTNLLSITSLGLKSNAPVLLPSGSDTAPSVAFISDSATGIHTENNKLCMGTQGVRRLELSSESLKVLSSQILVPNGTLMNPSYGFETAPGTGLSLDSDQNMVMSILTVPIVEVNSQGLTVKSIFGGSNGSRTFSNAGNSSLFLERGRGSFDTPAPVASGDILGIIRADGYIEDNNGTEVYSADSSQIIFHAQDNFTTNATGSYLEVLATKKGQNVANTKLTIGKDSQSTLHVNGSVGSSGTTITGPSTALEVNVKNTSKLLIDTANGNVQIKGFSGGQEGQILHLVKLNQVNNLELLHGDGTAVQSVLLKGSSSFLLSNDFGGIILSYDNGQWREISRS